MGGARYANGDVFVGQWGDDHAHGMGTLTYANGNTYQVHVCVCVRLCVCVWGGVY